MDTTALTAAARIAITAESTQLFMDLARDAGNWSGTPLVDVTPAERGNLTDLKRKGLLETMTDDGCVFALFTPAGIELAMELDPELTREEFGSW